MKLQYPKAWFERSAEVIEIEHDPEGGTSVAESS
jgi:hypothetical protein